MTGRTRRTPKRDWRVAFLTHLADGGHVRASAKAAGVARSTVYDERERNPAFAAAWVDALEESTEQLEREAIRRAAEGVEEPVFYLGKKVATVRKYSDTLLIFLLKGRRPTVYRDHMTHEVEQAGNGSVVALLGGRQPVDVHPDVREKIAALLEQQESDHPGDHAY